MGSIYKNRARIAILSDVFSFPSLGNMDWKSVYNGDELKINDLVSINGAPPSKWYLSWLQGINFNGGNERYLLESIEDGEMCWWTNIGLSYYTNREKILNNKYWRWTDEQFKFNDRWQEVCRKNFAYILVPCYPEFINDGSVFLTVRGRFSLDDYKNTVQFENWKKVTIKMMDDYYKDSLAKYEN